MASSNLNLGTKFWIACVLFLWLASPAAAFGAGNIPSIAQIEGLNFRHGGKQLESLAGTQILKVFRY